MRIDNRAMFYGATPITFEKARILRKNMTEAEEILWKELSKKKLEGIKFRRQHPIGRYIADFYCHQHKLVIELDGSIHEMEDQKEYDIGREEELNQLGLRVIRFTNDQVFKDVNNVLKVICEEMNRIDRL